MRNQTLLSDRSVRIVGMVALLAFAVVFVVLRTLVDVERLTPTTLSAQDLSPKQIQYLNTFVDARIKRVEDVTASLHKQGTLMVLGACVALYLVLRRKDQDFEIPVIRVKVPTRWARWVVPFVLAFWFLGWGHSLHLALDTRIAAWKLMETLEKSQGLDVDPVSPLSALSRTQWLRDNFLLDLWLLDSEPGTHGIAETGGFVNRGLLFCFAAVLGIILASSVACLIEAVCEVQFRAGRAIGMLLVVLMPSVFLLAMWQFTYGGGHPNWFCHAAFISAAVALPCIFWFQARFAEARAESAEPHP